MRKSKSDPAKYARNYRKISQRQMTKHDDADEGKEIERLRKILKESEEHLQGGRKKHIVKEDDDHGRRNQKRKRNQESNQGHNDDDDNDHDNDGDEKNTKQQQEDTEIVIEGVTIEGGEEDLVILPNKKKKTNKKKETIVELTREEIKEAKQLQKKTTRKLQQLQTRAIQKKQRMEVYKKLEQYQISSTTLDLLSRSGRIARKDVDTKKQTLQKLIKKERAGIDLTKDELDVLYPTREIDESQMEIETTPIPPTSTLHPKTSKQESKQKKKKERDEKKDSTVTDTLDDISRGDMATIEQSDIHIDSSDNDSKKNADEITSQKTPTVEAVEDQEPSQIPTGFDFAAQMMASLTKLKQETEKKMDEDNTSPTGALFDEVEIDPNKRYVASKPIELKTPATLGVKPSNLDQSRTVVHIQRPKEVEATRYDLPVSTMEYEIVDAIRNHDVTIICGETGSGKSTQVPAMLYEAGMCISQTKPKEKDETSFLIGITQPRRVAAVSTAKRVCYEMGYGDGQTIKNRGGNGGNLVSYKTRYETAGHGKDTRIQFMTDGILLQEIQTDLLLRRYSVIVLDEAHERNLNTDVLIGLLSVALPLRKKAAEEDPSIVPLKLVLMSATLRVEDFTRNDKLFPMGPPAVITVPGRTFPVTIHHSKVTDIEDYGEFGGYSYSRPIGETLMIPQYSFLLVSFFLSQNR